jgi:biopolymer transport protein ExbD
VAGGSYEAGDGDELIGGVNTTPLVDVTLTRLIVFIVTASFVVDRTMPVTLPKAASAEATPPSLLTISIAASGQVFLNGAPAQMEDIPAAVEAARARSTGGEAKLAGFVSADVAAPYGRFAEAVDRLRLAGVTEIALDTQPAAP